MSFKAKWGKNSKYISWNNETLSSLSWKHAMEDEIKVIKEQEVLTLKEKPLNAKLLGSMWIYALKCYNEEVNTI